MNHPMIKHSRSTIPIAMPLSSFKKWLAEQGKSAKTIEVYASYARTVLHNPEEARGMIRDPVKAHTVILEADAALAPASRGPFRAAIRAVDSWLRSRGAASILPKFPDGRRRELPTALDPLQWLGPLLAKIQVDANQDIPWQRVAELKWRHVEGTGGPDWLKIKDPGWGRSYTVPRPPMLEIAYWAGGGERPNPELPIIPREPGSTYPLPAAILRRLART